MESGAFFCPHCGAKLKEKPLSTGFARQLFYYIVSALLPPLGLWWAWKYWKQGDETAKKICYAIVAITLISLALNIWAVFGIVSSITESLNSELQQYQGL